jgi:hypothetical protein
VPTGEFFDEGGLVREGPLWVFTMPNQPRKGGLEEVNSLVGLRLQHGLFVQRSALGDMDIVPTGTQ